MTGVPMKFLVVLLFVLLFCVYPDVHAQSVKERLQRARQMEEEAELKKIKPPVESTNPQQPAVDPSETWSDGEAQDEVLAGTQAADEMAVLQKQKFDEGQRLLDDLNRLHKQLPLLEERILDINARKQEGEDTSEDEQSVLRDKAELENKIEDALRRITETKLKYDQKIRDVQQRYEQESLTK